MADDDAAVGDAGTIPAFPELCVLAPMLKKDVTDAGRVIGEGVGDLGRERKRPLKLAVRRTAWYCTTVSPLCLRTRPGKSEW